MADAVGRAPTIEAQVKADEQAGEALGSGADLHTELSAFVHHRRIQRFLGRDTAYSRRPYGRI